MEIGDNDCAGADEASGRDRHSVSHSAVEAKKAPGSHMSVATDDRAGGEKAVIVDPGVMRDTGLATDYTIIAN